MKIDFNKLKKIKELGAGVFGTAYLVELDGKKYVLKTQKILSSHKKKNLSMIYGEKWTSLNMLINYQTMNRFFL